MNKEEKPYMLILKKEGEEYKCIGKEPVLTQEEIIRKSVHESILNLAKHFPKNTKTKSNN